MGFSFPVSIILASKYVMKLFLHFSLLKPFFKQVSPCYSDHFLDFISVHVWSNLSFSVFHWACKFVKPIYAPENPWMTSNSSQKNVYYLCISYLVKSNELIKHNLPVMHTLLLLGVLFRIASCCFIQHCFHIKA